MWWDILKVDIDFIRPGENMQGLGHYESWGEPLQDMSNIKINHLYLCLLYLLRYLLDE